MSGSMRWTQEQLEEHLRGHTTRVVSTGNPVRVHPNAKPARSKHGNIRTEVDGIKFDSKLEARYYMQLKIEWRAGDVMWFTRQVRFELEGGVSYVCDFVVVRGNKSKAEVKSFHVYDCKGDPTQESLNKIKQVRARYGIKVELIKEADIMTGISV